MEAQNFVQKHRAEETERRARWKVLISTDARRVVRVLTAAGCSPETIDGDTWWDIPSILNCLQDPSKSPQSPVWRRLVRAGLFTALCKCSIKMQMMTLMPENAPPPTEEEKKARIKELASPWYEPLAIICTAAVGCAMPPTATEKQMFEEVKQDWTAIVQRIYSEPINSLRQDPYGMPERAILAQIVLRMSSLDPSFFDVIFKPIDMTLAVCFRGWVYATAREDAIINNSLILSLFGSSTIVSPWRDYFATHPAPSDGELIRRLIQGASMGVAGHKKLTLPHAARAIVAAFAKHLTMPGLVFSDVLQEVDFLATFWTVARKEFPAFWPAVCESEALWAALPRVVRRAVNEPRAAGRGLVSDVLMMYGKMIQTVVPGGSETHADVLVHCWVVGGLFDMLEEHLVRIMNISGGCMALTLMLNTIDLSHLSTSTRAELRAQLPRTGMVWTILKAGIASGENEDVGQYKRNIAGFFLAKGMPDPRNPVWRQGAWEMLAALGHKMRSPEDCARRGCDKAAGGLWCSAGACTGTRYCSRACMKGDVEHREMCSKGWFAVAEESSRNAMDAESPYIEDLLGMPDMASLKVEDVD